MVTLRIGPGAAVIALALHVTGSPAAAQAVPGGSTQPIDEVRTNYPWHPGPLYVNPSLLLKELGVDTNVFNEHTEEQSDFTFTVTPRLEIAVPFARRALLKTTGAADLVYYARFVSERSINPLATVRGEAYVRRITLFAEGGYLDTHDRVSQELDVRARHTDNSVLGGLSVRLTPKVSVEVAQKRVLTRFDRDETFNGVQLSQTLNQDSRTFSATGRHFSTPLTTVSAAYERQEDRFANEPTRNTDSYRVVPGVDFKPRALISGSAHVGYRSFTPHDTRLPAQTGLVSTLGLSYTLLGATTFGVVFDRDYRFSYSTDTPYYVDTGVGVTIRRAVGGHFDVLAQATRYRYVYERFGAAVPVDSQPAVPVETTHVYGASLGYRLKKETRLGVGVSYTERRSNNDASRDYSGFRFGATIRTGISR